MALNEMQEAARTLHALGLSTIPIKPKSKEPSCQHGAKDATLDDASTDAWYAAHPNDGIGIVGDGLCIFDFDVKEGVDGRDALIGWDLPDTLCQTTPSGGYHMIYRADREVRPSVNSEIAVDVRGYHSYIVCDPTPGYCFEELREPADANDAVYSFLNSIRPQSVSAAKVKGVGRPKKDEPVKEGGRNDYLFRQGCSMRAKLPNDDNVIIAALHAYNEVNCKPPLPTAEVDKIAASVLALPAGLSDEAKEAAKKAKSANHVAVSTALLNDCHACFIDGVPAVYDGERYLTGWTGIQQIILREWPNSKDKDRNEVIKYLNLTMPHMEQASARYIAFTNGVLDVSTMELLPFSADLIIPNVIPHAWNPKARSNILNVTIQRIACGNPTIESNLFEFIGLSMYRSSKYAFAAILLGNDNRNASNGKSTYIDLIRNVIGVDNYSSLSLQSLGENNAAVGLMGKLANLGDDISSEFAKGASLEVFKKAVSGSVINSNVKFLPRVEFKPYCTMVFSANEMPKIEKLDDGTLRRIFPIRFAAYFTPDNPDFDPDIGEKLAQEDVIEAAIVRGIAGLRRVIANKKPTPNAESMRMVAEIKTDNNTVLQWLEDDSLDAAALDGMTIAGAYDTYNEWCKQSGVHSFGKKEFAKKVRVALNMDVLVTSRNNKSARVFKGRNDGY